MALYLVKYRIFLQESSGKNLPLHSLLCSDSYGFVCDWWKLCFSFFGASPFQRCSLKWLISAEGVLELYRPKIISALPDPLYIMLCEWVSHCVLLS